MRPEPGQVQAAAVSPAPTTTPTTESIRSSLPPSKLSAESYPRPAWVRVLRRILQLWWLAFALYPANALFNLYSLVAHSGFSALLNSGNLMQALLLDQLVPLLVTSPAVVVPVLGIVGLLILGGHWAQTDRQRERQVLAERAAQQARAAEREAVVQQARAAVVAAVSDLVQQQLQTVGTTASHEVAQPQGPPFDEGLLPRPAHFVGREDDVAWVRSRLGERGSVTALLGMGGLGKTTLASMAVQRAHGEERFADGIAVVLCQDLTDATELLRRVLARFDPYRRTPDASTLPELAEAASRTLRGKDALVVLDNLEPALAVAGVLRPLEAAGLTLLLTARQALPRDVVPIEASRQLQLLSDEDCLTLFAQTLGRGSPDALSAAEHAAARRIIEALGRHTLAVKIAAAYAADVRRDLGALAGELEQEGEQALELADGEAPRALARIFAQSTEALPPDARRFFAACAAFATPEFGRQAALTLGRALGYASPETSLNLLVLRALLEASVADRLPDGSDRERLRFHPLLRAFCESLFARWGTQDQEVAKRAAAVHYAACASSWPQTALAADEANIIGALAWTCAHDENELTAAICDGMQQFWFVRARTHDSLHFLPLGIAACEATMAAYSQTHRTPNGELPDEQRLVRLLGSYGEVLTRTGQMDTAAETLEKALKLARQIHYRQGEAVDLSRLGEVAWLRGHMEEAESFARQALAIRREVHDRQGEATDLSGLGAVAWMQGRLEEAEEYFQQALVIRQESHDQHGEAMDVANLGAVARLRGRLQEAEGYYLESLALRREVHDLQGEAVDLWSLGTVARLRGHLDDAESYYRQALALRRTVQDQQGEAVDLAGLGAVARLRGQLAEAEDYYQQSLALHRAVQDRQGEGANLADLGTVALLRGSVEEAEDYYRQALLVLRAVQDQRWEATALSGLAEIEALRGDHKQAEALYHQALDLARATQSGPELVRILLAFGRYLVEQGARREDGCAMLQEAFQLSSTMGRGAEGA